MVQCQTNCGYSEKLLEKIRMTALGLLIAAKLIVTRKVIAGEIIESCVLAFKLQAAGADLAVSLLADNNLSDTFIWAVLVVILVPVEKQDYVSILLNGARFT